MNEATSFDDVWSTLWAMRLTIVVAVVVGAVMGFGIHQVWPDRYRSTAVYTVSPLGTAATSGTTTQVNMDTEVVIATSDAVVDRAAKSLGVPATVISGALEVTVPQGSDALELAYTADSPSEAAKGANAVAAAYGENRSANAEAIVADARRNITVSIAETQALIDASAEGSPRERGPSAPGLGAPTAAGRSRGDHALPRNTRHQRAAAEDVDDSQRQAVRRQRRGAGSARGFPARPAPRPTPRQVAGARRGRGGIIRPAGT